MAACQKLSKYLYKNQMSKFVLKNNFNVIYLSSRGFWNALGERKVCRPKLSRPKPRLAPRPNDRIIWPDADSVKERGFLRPQKEYIPPSDAEIKLNELFRKVVGTTELSTPLNDETIKFNLLDACFQEFSHKVPNSILHKFSTLDNVYQYYLSSVDVRTPLEAMKTRADLPPNVHILYEYHRFTEDDTKFNGVTAFPESNTVVTGLRYKQKYKGFTAPRPKPVYEDEYKL